MEDDLIIIEAPVQEPIGEEADAWELVEQEGDGETALSSLPCAHACGPAEAHVEMDEATAGAENEAAAGAPNDAETCGPAGSHVGGAPHQSDQQDEEEEDQGENDTTDGAATGEIEMTDCEDASDETPSCCAEELKSACEALCAQTVDMLQHAKEFGADLNAKAHVALGELKPQLIQAYTDSAAVCGATVQKQAKHTAGKINNAVAKMDIIPRQPGLVVLMPAMVIAALLVGILSWLASSGGVVEVALHNQVHMETLALLENEMWRLETKHYQNSLIHVAQPPAPGVTATNKSRTAAKKNRTPGLGRSAVSKPGTQAHGGKTRKDTHKVARINSTHMFPNDTFSRPSTLVACEQPRATNISDDTPTSIESTALVHTASLPAEGWFTMNQHIIEANMNRAPLRTAGIHSPIGDWLSGGNHLAARAGWVQRRDETVDDILLARPLVDGWAIETAKPALSKLRARWSNKSPCARSGSTALALADQIDMGRCVYTASENNQLVLRSDTNMLHLNQQQTAKLNLSVLALGDGTMWPTIPLPSSPTIRPPISMPPIAMPMPPVGSAISMPPVAISLGSSDNVLLTNAIAIRPSSTLEYSSSYLTPAEPTVAGGEFSPRCYGKSARNSASIANGTHPWSAPVSGRVWHSCARWR